MSNEPEDEHRFGSGEPFSVGVEEELFLVDPVTGRQANTSAAVLARLSELDGRIERELHACQIELITGVHASAGDAVRELAELRHAVLGTRAGIIGSGTHPSAEEGARCTVALSIAATRGCSLVPAWPASPCGVPAAL